MTKRDRRATRSSRKIARDRAKHNAPVFESANKSSSESRQAFVIVGLLSLLVIAAYSNSLYAGFVFDDHAIIVKNPLIRSLTRLPALFITGYWDTEGYQTDQLYRPLVMSTYAFNYAIGGLHSLGYHLTNLTLHLAVCVTLYGLGRQIGLSRAAAFAASAVFAVHPSNTEAVTGIVGRAELMMALGVLLALVLDIKDNPLNRPATRVSVASNLAFLAALLSKEQAVMLPILLLVCNAIRMDASGITWSAELKQGRKRYLVWLLLLVAYFVLRHSVLTGFLPARAAFVENPLAHVDFVTRVMTATKVAGYYLWLVLWPAKLSADYSYNAIPVTASPLNAGVLFGALAWVSICTAAFLALRRRNAPVVIGTSIAVLFFLPVSNFIVAIGTIMGERLFYLPFAGLCLAFGGGIAMLLSRTAQRKLRWAKRVGTGVFVLAISLLTIRTIARNRDWADDFNLFRSAVAVNPNAAKSRLLLGAWLARQGHGVEGLAELEKAVTIYPNYALRHTFAEEMGNLLLSAGRTDEALSLAEKALAASPDHPSLLHLYGLALQNRQQWDDAVASHQRALQVTRQVNGEDSILFVNGLYNLSRAYAFQGRYVEADEHLNRAVEIMDASLRNSVSPRDVARFVAFQAVIRSTHEGYQSAKPLFRRLLSIIEASPRPADFIVLSQPLESFAQHLRASHQEAEAARVERQLERISSPR